jgi:hypothetical protein
MWVLWCLIAIVVGLITDGLDYVFWTPRGPIGFERQVGPFGCLGRLVWKGAIIVFLVLLLIKLSHL